MWQNLTHHIQHYACPSFDSSKAPPEQLQAHRRQLLAYHDQGELQPLRQDRELCYFLSQRCILCGFWSARLQQMSAHMGRDHPEAYNLMSEVLPNVTRARMPSPCALCGQEFKSRTHTCPVKKQLGLALADRRHRAECPESPPPVPQPVQRVDASCASCPRKFVTMARLHQHQALEHPHTTTARTFLADRDQVPGRNQCSHCDQEVLCLEALKHHIIAVASSCHCHGTTWGHL